MGVGFRGGRRWRTMVFLGEKFWFYRWKKTEVTVGRRNSGFGSLGGLWVERVVDGEVKMVEKGFLL